MYYILMGIDECGTEIRLDNNSYQEYDVAQGVMHSIIKGGSYEEYRHLWIETSNDPEYGYDYYDEEF